ncbi:MAG: FIST C-terminal domain-containing protein [Elusimicrobia bacterium]|jgi:hypothetical protein|nr:FIST C-terminal domain-containing protein [Elusimicrobiota bacterium]MBK8652036.1 FIST C-terminal domain-containing protein [Elusimicrobiota bacterium]MBP8004978.1 FIST C-terminal domain-containing protein [Elusimicrobiota bacterium]
MKTELVKWTPAGGWSPAPPGRLSGAQWVLVFGSPEHLHPRRAFDELRLAYPNAFIMGCSTAGEIFDTDVLDDHRVVTAIQFDHSRVVGASAPLADAADSRAAGVALARTLPAEELRHVFVLAEGLHVNGSALIEGLVQTLPPSVGVTGGLAGDGTRFKETLVMANGPAETNRVVATGFYGQQLRVGHGSLGGWDPFGPERLITRSKNNVLFELDGRSALALYKNYLGEHAQDLPASALLFPLCVRPPDTRDWLVRTVLAINENERSMTFAGDVPEGHIARLMRANFDRLIDGAMAAADSGKNRLGVEPGLALLISCVGRKMVLKHRTVEEVEGVRTVLGPRVPAAGFYSYGEISPLKPQGRCELHNQTMTITTFAETDGRA